LLLVAVVAAKILVVAAAQADYYLGPLG